ncbi:MAG: rhodanese-like domain-containing protein [Alphaproteobacteria bacterium]|nr:rhodanese-like domain-containing protein [Alphaproteobacteria bacterium]
MSDSRASVLITADALVAAISTDETIVLLDISDDLETAPLERAVIPGAIAASLAADISGPATKPGGRRPLPDPAVLQEGLRLWGIDANSLVVVYDNASGSQAGRAWWTLRWAGHTNTRLLDGGLGAWTAAGHQTADQPIHPAGSGNFTVIPGNMPVIDADEAAGIARNGALLDARGKTAYEGDPDKPASGHIPGAICAGAKDALGDDGCFKPTEDLNALYAGHGANGSQPVGVYCGSGNAASFELAGMYAAGLEAPLYVGSWSAWSADPDRPVAQGAERG